MAFNKEETRPASLVGTFYSVNEISFEKKHVVFLGRSNSGKSTLLSSLIHNSSIVKTSSNPGSTRSINVYDRGNVYLTDLPGYGFAKTSFAGRDKLSQLISEFLNHTDYIAAGFLTVDVRRNLAEEEKYITDFFRQNRLPLNIVFSKVDKLNQKQMAAARKKNKNYESLCHNLIYYSAIKKIQLDFIYRYIDTL